MTKKLALGVLLYADYSLDELAELGNNLVAYVVKLIFPPVNTCGEKSTCSVDTFFPLL